MNAPEASEEGQSAPMGADLQVVTQAELVSLMKPVGSLSEIRQAFNDYQDLTRSLLTDDDYQTIGNKRFPKKSTWRKLSTAFGVTFRISDRHIELDDNGRVRRADFTVTAIAPNGRAMDGWGSCDVTEKCCAKGCSKNFREHNHCPAARGERCDGAIHFSHPNHDIPATAETRAKNRAASDLFGMGEVSAEEIMDADSGSAARPRPAATPQSARSATPEPEDESQSLPDDDKALIFRLRRDIKQHAPNHPSVMDGTIRAKSPKELVEIATAIGLPGFSADA